MPVESRSAQTNSGGVGHLRPQPVDRRVGGGGEVVRDRAEHVRGRRLGNRAGQAGHGLGRVKRKAAHAVTCHSSMEMVPYRGCQRALPTDKASVKCSTRLWDPLVTVSRPDTSRMSILASVGCQPEATSCCQPGSGCTSKPLTVWWTPAFASASHWDDETIGDPADWTRCGSSSDRNRILSATDAGTAGSRYGASWACSQDPKALRDRREYRMSSRAATNVLSPGLRGCRRGQSRPAAGDLRPRDLHGLHLGQVGELALGQVLVDLFLLGCPTGCPRCRASAGRGPEPLPRSVVDVVVARPALGVRRWPLPDVSVSTSPAIRAAATAASRPPRTDTRRSRVTVRSRCFADGRRRWSDE